MHVGVGQSQRPEPWRVLSHVTDAPDTAQVTHAWRNPGHTHLLRSFHRCSKTKQTRLSSYRSRGDGGDLIGPQENDPFLVRIPSFHSTSGGGHVLHLEIRVSERGRSSCAPWPPPPVWTDTRPPSPRRAQTHPATLHEVRKLTTGVNETDDS